VSSHSLDKITNGIEVASVEVSSRYAESNYNPSCISNNDSSNLKPFNNLVQRAHLLNATDPLINGYNKNLIVYMEQGFNYDISEEKSDPNRVEAYNKGKNRALDDPGEYNSLANFHRNEPSNVNNLNINNLYGPDQVYTNVGLNQHNYGGYGTLSSNILQNNYLTSDLNNIAPLNLQSYSDSSNIYVPDQVYTNVGLNQHNYGGYGTLSSNILQNNNPTIDLNDLAPLNTAGPSKIINIKNTNPFYNFNSNSYLDSVPDDTFSSRLIQKEDIQNGLNLQSLYNMIMGLVEDGSITQTKTLQDLPYQSYKVKCDFYKKIGQLKLFTNGLQKYAQVTIVNFLEVLETHLNHELPTRRQNYDSNLLGYLPDDTFSSKLIQKEDIQNGLNLQSLYNKIMGLVEDGSITQTKTLQDLPYQSNRVKWDFYKKIRQLKLFTNGLQKYAQVTIANFLEVLETHLNHELPTRRQNYDSNLLGYLPDDTFSSKLIQKEDVQNGLNLQSIYNKIMGLVEDGSITNTDLVWQLPFINNEVKSDFYDKLTELNLIHGRKEYSLVKIEVFINLLKIHVDMPIGEYNQLRDADLATLKVNKTYKPLLVKGEDFEKEFESITDTIKYFGTLDIKLDRKPLYLHLKSGKIYKNYFFYYK
jgi:hypothetical protein